MERIADQEQRQAVIAAESSKYIAAHPQLKQLLHDFTTAVLASRPSDVHQFAHDYFAAFIPPARDPAAEDEEDSAAASAAASVDAGEAATPLDSAQQQEQEEEE